MSRCRKDALYNFKNNHDDVCTWNFTLSLDVDVRNRLLLSVEHLHTIHMLSTRHRLVLATMSHHAHRHSHSQTNHSNHNHDAQSHSQSQLQSSQSQSQPQSHPTSLSSSSTDKGKKKEMPESTIPQPASPVDVTLVSKIQEALETPLSPVPVTPSSIDSTFDGRSTIPHPPRAIHAPSRGPLNHPRLVSQLTRATLPVSSLSYATTDSTRPSRTRAASDSGLQQYGESSTSWRKSMMTIDDPFPDLDPSSGLPMDPSRDSIDEFSPSTKTAPSLHLQRTITSLLGTRKDSSESSIFPTLSTLGGVMPNLGLRRSLSARSLSTSAPAQQQRPEQGDWTSWATSWWGGTSKGKVDRMMSEEDQAETVDEEKDKLRKKCRFALNTRGVPLI